MKTLEVKNNLRGRRGTAGTGRGAGAEKKVEHQGPPSLKGGKSGKAVVHQRRSVCTTGVPGEEGQRKYVKTKQLKLPQMW